MNNYAKAGIGLAILITVIGWVGCVGFVGYVGWNRWFGRDNITRSTVNAGQSASIKSELRAYGGKLSDNQTLTIISQGLTYAGDSEFAIKVVNRINDDGAKAAALRAVADSLAKIGDKEKASALLSDAVMAVGRTSDVD